MTTSKSELRKQLKFARLEMTDAEHTLKSRAIVDNLIQAQDWSQVKTVHYFEPIAELLEVDISGFVTYLQDTYPDIKLFTTKQIGKAWDIIARQDGAIPDTFDVIIVPMLGFDKSLHRIGYGGGFYDKFLSTQPEAQKIGVCFEQGRLDKLPAEEHDVPLDQIITEDTDYSR